MFIIEKWKLVDRYCLVNMFWFLLLKVVYNILLGWCLNYWNLNLFMKCIIRDWDVFVFLFVLFFVYELVIISGIGKLVFRGCEECLGKVIKYDNIIILYEYNFFNWYD